MHCFAAACRCCFSCFIYLCSLLMFVCPAHLLFTCSAHLFTVLHAMLLFFGVLLVHACLLHASLASCLLMPFDLRCVFCCPSECAYIHIYQKYMYIFVCTYARMNACMCVCVFVCMYVCMHACMYVCTYACMYECM